MNEYTALYVEKIGPRGGKSWNRVSTITNGAFCITRPGTYKTTRFVNRFAAGSRVITITQAEIDRETWEPGKIGPHGMGIEIQ